MDIDYQQRQKQRLDRNRPQQHLGGDLFGFSSARADWKPKHRGTRIGFGVLVTTMTALLLGTGFTDRLSAQGWELEQIFPLGHKKEAAQGKEKLFDVTRTESGALIAGGEEAIYRRAQDSEEWQVVDDINLDDPLGNTSLATTGNTVYAAIEDAGDWVVRRSTDDGKTWLESDRFPSVEPADIALSSDGTVYVLGRAGGYWTVRRFPSLSGDVQWETVDRFQLDPGAAEPAAISVQGDRVLVCGKGFDGENGWWIVRESLDGGASWETVDKYRRTGRNRDLAGEATDILMGESYDYVVGRALDSGKMLDIVRRRDYRKREPNGKRSRLTTLRKNP